MKNIHLFFKNILFLLLITGSSAMYAMPAIPSANDEDTNDTEENNPAPSPASAKQNKQPSKTPMEVPIQKSITLQWPDTTHIAEDNKNLIQSNNEKIIQLFTQAQDVCNNIDAILSTLNKFRDEANTKYRDTIKEFDPLFASVPYKETGKK